MITHGQTKETPITLELFIEELNKDIAWEYAAAIQYINHAATIKGAAYMRMADELSKHADEEMEHAKILATIVDDLGGMPGTEVEKVYISNAKKAVEMLNQDLRNERLVMERYVNRIEQAAQLQLYDVQETLGHILAVEREHERDLLMGLGE